MGERSLDGQHRLDPDPRKRGNVPQWTEPSIVQVVRRSGADQVRGNDGLEARRAPDRQMPGVPTGALCAGKPLMQVESSPDEAIPLVNRKPVRTAEDDKLVACGRRSMNRGHMASPA